jgi:hypothetical protein
MAPLAGSHRVASGHDTESGFETINILFSLADKDGSGAAAQQLGKPVEYEPDTFEIPDPTAPAIRPSLPKVLRLEPNYLKQQVSGFIEVVVCVGDTLCIIGSRSADQAEDRISSGSKIHAGQFRLETDEVPPSAALRMAVRLAGLDTCSKRIARSIVDWAWSTQFFAPPL